MKKEAPILDSFSVHVYQMARVNFFLSCLEKKMNQRFWQFFFSSPKIFEFSFVLESWFLNNIWAHARRNHRIFWLHPLFQHTKFFSFTALQNDLALCHKSTLQYGTEYLIIKALQCHMSRASKQVWKKNTMENHFYFCRVGNFKTMNKLKTSHEIFFHMIFIKIPNQLLWLQINSRFSFPE